MAARRMGCISLILCLCLCVLSYTALGASTADAREPIAVDRACDLTVSYRWDDMAFSGQKILLYAVADVSADGVYTINEDFTGALPELNGIQSHSEWDVIRTTLEAYIFGETIAPVETAITDETGQATFSALKPGLYLLSSLTVEQEDLSCFFDTALVALPGLDAEGLWQYSLAVAAKPQLITPPEPGEKIQFQVLKLWKNDSSNSRPVNIEVEIFRNGVSVERVILSEKNNWSYQWTAEDDGASWNVVERNIPSGYRVTVEERTTTFLLTNSRTPDTPEQPPYTGDSSHISLYIVLMLVSGCVLLLFGLAGKRKRA